MTCLTPVENCWPVREQNNTKDAHIAKRCIQRKHPVNTCSTINTI